MYQTIWRWHFYAGLFCIPFIIVLAITGAVYLFKPQVETTLFKPYSHLAISGERASPEAQVMAALRAVPDAQLNAYELPETSSSAVQVLVKKQGELTRVYIHPHTLKVLKIEQEDAKLMNVVHRLHGNLLIGDRGSNLVELAASWAIVMIITGLYLWWPSNINSLAGILYPRITKTSRTFWRDLHAVTGFWISFFALFLLLSGLPWAKSWGGLLKEVRQLNAGKVVAQDWSTGPSSAPVKRQSATISGMDTDHAEHEAHISVQQDMNKHQHPHEMAPHEADYRPLNSLVGSVQALNLAAPVLISPPSKKSPSWAASSKAQNRPLRVDLTLNAQDGTIQSRKNFADRPLLDRIIGYGIAIHEGQLFGWLNQLLGLIAALGLVLLSVSATVLWWRRRLTGTLGAPPARANASLAPYLIVIIVLLSVALPFLGLSLMLTLLVERWVLRYIPTARNFLGLN